MVKTSPFHGDISSSNLDVPIYLMALSLIGKTRLFGSCVICSNQLEPVGNYMPYKDKKKQREYMRIWVKNRRKEYFKDKVCKKCNSKIKLELHHIDPFIKNSHKIWSWSKEKREEELKKCIVLCCNCHKEISNESMRKQITHGTNTGYSHYNCRCVECKKGHNEYCRGWYHKNKYNKHSGI